MAAISAFLLVLHVVLVLGFVLRVLLRNGLAATTRMAWIGVILLLPYVGCLLYFLFGDADIGRGVLGRYKRVRDLVREQIADDAQAALVMGAPGGMEALVGPRWQGVFRYAASVNGFGPVPGNLGELMADGDTARARMLADIEAARHHISVLYYIWLDDQTGTEVAEALMRAARRGVAGIQDHQPRILDPAVGIFVGLEEFRFERRPFPRAVQRKGRGAGQDLSPAQIVIHEQAQPDQPGGPPPLHPGHDEAEDFRSRRLGLEPHVLVVGQHEAHRPTDMRHGAQQNLAFDQRLADKAEFEIFEIAQAAVEHLGRRGGGGGGKVAHLGQNHRQSPPRRVAGDAASVDAAADDEKIGCLTVRRVRHESPPGPLPRTFRR